MYNKYPDVFKPLKVGNTTFKNRLQFPPMVCCHSNSKGEVTQEYVNFIEMQARTGVSLVTIGATPVNRDTAVDYNGELNISDDLMLPGLHRIAMAAHDFGAKISVEMCHGGRGADQSLLTTPYALAPSVVPIPGNDGPIKEMDQNDIDDIINDYANCADRLAKAGFDFCMVHAAHGNLISQFMSPMTNLRTDAYGGSFENRMRFPLQVLEAMRAKVGHRINIEMRVSGDEIIPEGLHLEDTIAFLKMAQEYVDLINVSRGMIVDNRYNFYTQPPYYNERCHNVKYAAKIKEVIDVPISVVGSIKTLAEAQDIISTGKADVVSMCRQLMADPDTIRKSRAGKEEDVRPCLRCLQYCNKNVDEGRPVRCSINPSVGREGKYLDIYPSPSPKKVVVIGGGAAGMMAAQTCIKKGHQVVLFEAEDHLGGHLPDINKLPFKQDLREYTEWDVRTTLKCGADVRLGVKATPEMAAAENPDVVIMATGSTLLNLPIPGINGSNVYDVISVDNGTAKIPAENVIVCGGGMSGLESALGLAMDGKKVTVLDMIPAESFGRGTVRFTINMLKKLLDDHGVQLVGDVRIKEITDKGVTATAKDGTDRFFPAEAVVTAFGLRANTERHEEFAAIAPEFYVIGDALNQEKSIGNANTTAFNTVVML